jgi:membrane-bound ClpP family serine protease
MTVDKPNPTVANVKKNVHVARFLVVVGVGLLVWGISVGSVDRSVLGGFLLILGIVGYAQEKKKPLKKIKSEVSTDKGI